MVPLKIGKQCWFVKENSFWEAPKFLIPLLYLFVYLFIVLTEEISVQALTLAIRILELQELRLRFNLKGLQVSLTKKQKVAP